MSDEQKQEPQAEAADPRGTPHSPQDAVNTLVSAAKTLNRNVGRMRAFIKMTKGKSPLTSQEVVEVFEALMAYISAMDLLTGFSTRQLSSLIARLDIRDEVICKVLIDKGLTTKEDLETLTTTIIDEKRKAVEAAQKAEFEKSVAQAQEPAAPASESQPPA